MSTKFMNPAIVVAAYNRPKSLKRLLDSIAKASYDYYIDIPLVISIDKNDISEVNEIANKFVWNYGVKEIIEHKEHLGLKKHILTCGNLTEKYDCIILLEDDLFVSPAFYDYSVQAIKFYLNENRISGISLYSDAFNHYARMRFIPIDDGYDNYFIQSASSWGQIWTRKQWFDFIQWYDLNQNVTLSHEDKLPESVINWSDKSWKKYFIKYMVLKDKYFVFPRISLSTNYGEIGSHQMKNINLFQVSLCLCKKVFNFSKFDKSLSFYDSHYELKANCLKHFNPSLKNFNFECDLYGTKELNKINTEYIISIRECSCPIFSYALEQLPQENNIAFNIEGDYFNLGLTSNFTNVNIKKEIKQLEQIHKVTGLKRYAFWFAFNLFSIIKKKLKFRI